ncbi:TetR/AcrR family transcriptional regulator [Williamsia sp.]|uniref:TetR/AcrR family transcriptional regulator n=1 Tax=Williamsia sp. TaxID=1872085 RepID=UPI001A31185A|nr:TetR/AcrR family transcriptional regulator [Williamsia sp.]MBJ7289579.1 TetR/AcrR family transcriptional regulator [Williamsia sp.]
MTVEAHRTNTGRPLTARGRETRARIVGAAAELMLDTGVAGTTMEDVRARAGVSNSQIYHYFSDKYALVHAVIAHQDETIVGAHEAMFAELDTIDGLRQWCAWIVEYQRLGGCSGGCPLGSLGVQVAEVDPGARAGVAQALSRWERAIRRGYESMRSGGVLRADVDTESLARSTLASLQGGLLMAQIHRDTAPLEAALDAVIAHARLLTTAEYR